jgi:hypothetical protein
VGADLHRAAAARDLVDRAADAYRHWQSHAGSSTACADGCDIDRVNQDALVRILSRRHRSGLLAWPELAHVGEPGSRAALAIALRAPELERQRLFLQALRAAADRGGAPLAQWAHLLDLVQAKSGLEQTYGTVWWRTPAGSAPYPIAPGEDLDTRRARVGLGKLPDRLDIPDHLASQHLAHFPGHGRRPGPDDSAARPAPPSGRVAEARARGTARVPGLPQPTRPEQPTRDVNACLPAAGSTRDAPALASTPHAFPSPAWNASAASIRTPRAPGPAPAGRRRTAAAAVSLAEPASPDGVHCCRGEE